MADSQYHGLHRPQMRELRQVAHWSSVVLTEDLVSWMALWEDLPFQSVDGPLDPTSTRQFVPRYWCCRPALPSCQIGLEK